MVGLRLESLRERFEPVDFGAVCVLAVVLLAASGGVVEWFVGVAAFLVVVPAVDWLLERTGVSEAATGVLFGTVVAGFGVVVLARGDSLWIGSGLLAVGCWLALDSLYDSRYGEPTAEGSNDDISEAELYTLMGHSQWVLEALREADRPLTAEELRSRTGLTEDELEAVLEITRENGTVEAVGTGYAVNEDGFGGVAFVRGIAVGVARRLLRPLRLVRPSR